MESWLSGGMKSRNTLETTQPGLSPMTRTGHQSQSAMSSIGTAWMFTPIHTHSRKEAKVSNVSRSPITDKN